MTKKIAFLSLALCAITMYSYAQSTFGELRGKITDARTGEPLIGANIVAIMDGIQRGGASTNLSGEYNIKPLPPGTYNIHASYIGYRDIIVQGYVIRTGMISFQDVKMSLTAVETDEIEYVAYRKPLVDKEEGSRHTLGAEEIQKAPTRSVGELVQLTPGVQGSSIRGQRGEGTIYFVDGIRVRGSLAVPQGMIAEISTITGGVSAEYGDFMGGVVSITTRGPSNRFTGSIEAITSELIDPFGYNTIEGALSGPLLFKDRKTDSKEAIMGFLISGNVNYRRDPSPSPVGVWKVKEDVYDYLYENPLSPAPGGIGFVPSAEYITKEGMERVKIHPDIQSFSYNLSGKVDWQPAKNTTLTLGGAAAHSRGKGYSWTYSLFNYKEASKVQFLTNTVRTYVRFTQRLNVGDQDAESRDKKGVKISNVFYTIMADYTKQFNTTQHEEHKDEFFKYGHLGTYERYRENVYRYDYDTVNGKLEQAFLFSGYRDTLVVFTPSEYNTGRANYTKQLYELRDGLIRNTNTIQQLGGLLNGDNPGNVYSLWTNIGGIATGYSRYDEDQFRVTGKASLDVNKHAISFGFEYEQRFQRAYSVGANSLWTVMRQLANSHLLQLDTRNPIPLYDKDGFFLDTIHYNILDDGKQSTFDKNFRNHLISKGATDVYGNPITNQTLINIDRYAPEEFSLDMFSPDELLSRGMVNYYGFDYLGRRLKSKPSFEDFLDSDERLIAPINPVYMAGFIEDKFYFRDMIFRIGLRVDRFDANQKVLIDKYSLYPTRQVSEVTEINGKGVTHPGNMGNDYVVYVDNAFNPTRVVGYRQGDNWFNSAGAEITDPNILALETTTGNIAPYLVEENEDDLKLSSASFTDYDPQIDLSPRVYFSFPISDEANFFANYDIRVQRPTAGIFTTIDDYYYMQQRGTSSLNNAGLKPQRVTSYEVGFKQALSRNSAITINAYYNETRNLINVRMINQAYPRTYMTFDNIDFSTVKGLSLSYDLRRTRTNNIQLMTSYTLQFADGTGSSAASQANLVAAGQPNLRTPFPLSNDYRHAMSGQIDYRFRGGELYNGPISKKGKRILEHSGAQFIVTATSGRPYTKQGNVTQAVGIGIRQSETMKGTLNGSRYPWIYNVNVKVDKDFFFYRKNDKDKKMTSQPFMAMNVYIWVQNLFNIRNIQYVYRFTGDPNDDGFLASPSGIRTIEEATYGQAYLDHYLIKVNNPAHYSLPRLGRLGVILSF